MQKRECVRLTHDVVNKSLFKPYDSFAAFLYCRHPESKARPRFPDVLRLLSGPNEELLKWSEEDLSIHPFAATLGVDISISENLYTDLQMAYV